jgi:hypothetical protein
MQPLRGCVYGYGPEEADEEKYDETAASMIALMRYGSGFPSYRLEGLQENMGIPLPAATQCEIVKETAAQIRRAMSCFLANQLEKRISRSLLCSTRPHD